MENALPLEESLVSTLRGYDKSEEDVRKTCEDLVSGRILPLNLRLVDSALKKYEMLLAYYSQNNSRRAIRKRIRANFEEIVREKIKEFKETDSSILSGKAVLDRDSSDECPCGGKKETYDIITTSMIRLSDGSYVRRDIKDSNRIFCYCWKCGEDSSPGD